MKGEIYFPLNSIIKDEKQGTEYILKKLIGRGAYAQCFLAIANNEAYAMKIVKYCEMKSEKLRNKLESEIIIHGSLDHKNIVKMYRHFRDSEYVYMVLELCERGALDELLRRNGKLKEKYVSKFVEQLVNGLSYLHDVKSVVHRDLKLGNIFLDNMLNIKIGDFGLSAEIKGNEKRQTVCGTPNYIAPEVLFGKASGHSFEADIWSLGVIIYTLLIGMPPFQKKKVEEIYKQIELNKYIFPPNNTLSSEAIDLIMRLLTTNPNDRPTLQQIKEHKFLNQKENLAYRVYRNLFVGNYRLGEIDGEYVTYSTPVFALGGIGYVLRSGTYGIYFHDLTNAFIKGPSLVYIKLRQENGRKVFITEEHSIAKLPDCLVPTYKKIQLFLMKYTPTFIRSKLFDKENFINTLPEKTIIKNAFVAKIKKIKDGLFFIMTNNFFIFDFYFGDRVVIANDGTSVFTFNDDGPIDFSDALKQTCISTLKFYSTTK